MAGKGSTRYKSIAARLVGGKPLAYKLREDGSLVVIGPDGCKSHFSPEQVKDAMQAGNARPKKTNQGAG